MNFLKGVIAGFLFLSFLGCNSQSKTEKKSDIEYTNAGNTVTKVDVPTKKKDTINNAVDTANIEDFKVEEKTSDLSLEFNHKIKHKTPVFCPKISPDGSMVLATNAGNYGILVFDLKSDTLIAEVAIAKKVGFNAVWAENSKAIFYREKVNKQWTTKKYDLVKGEISEHTDVDPNTLQSYVVSEPSQGPIFKINEQLEIVKMDWDGTNPEVVFEEQGQYYNPLLSPNLNYLVAHNGNKIMLSDLIKDKQVEATHGLASSWLPNSEGFVFFRDESVDGHQITGSEIYLYVLKTKVIINVTNTNDKIELWPSVDNQGKKLTCEEGNTGEILVYDIVY